MPLPRQHDDIARLGVPDRIAHRLSPVCDPDVCPPGSPDTRLDVIQDRLRILPARIIGRQDREIRQMPRRLPHPRAAQSGTVSAAAKQHDQPVRRKSAKHLQKLPETHLIVSIVDEQHVFP